MFFMVKTKYLFTGLFFLLLATNIFAGDYYSLEVTNTNFNPNNNGDITLTFDLKIIDKYGGMGDYAWNDIRGLTFMIYRSSDFSLIEGAILSKS